MKSIIQLWVNNILNLNEKEAMELYNKVPRLLKDEVTKELKKHQK